LGRRAAGVVAAGEGKLTAIRRLVIYLDNGPKNSGSRTQFLKRMIEFADWSGLEIRLVYYPPYHSKYNPIEHCWSSLEQKWGGTLLNCLKVILQEALRPASDREKIARRIPRRSPSNQEGNEALRSSLGTIERLAQIRHRDPTNPNEMWVNHLLPLA